MELWQDARYAVRRLVEARWFTLAAVAALAVGIGANTAGFTIVNAVLLRGLPFEDADRIVAVWSTFENGGEAGLSYPDIEDVRERTRSLSHLVGIVGASANLADDELVAERVDGAYVSASFFDLLAEEPVIGRAFTEDDDRPGAEPVVVIGYRLWQNRYAGSSDVLGQTLRVNSLLTTIVGVAPEGLFFPDDTEIWIPKDNLPPESQVENRGTRGRNVIGRIAPGATIAQVREEVRGIGRGLADEYPETNADVSFNVQDFNTRINGGEITIIFSMLMGAVVFLLLIACANVANLLLAKSADRSREIAVRVSLGATRWRIVRQLLVESLLIALLAGVIGLALGVWGVQWFDGVTQNVGKPYWMVFSLDPIVFVYVAGVCLGTAVLFGLAPALQVSKTDVNDVLKEGTRGGSGGVRTRRWAGAFVIGEIVLTVVLLSGAAFFTRSFFNLYTREAGFETDALLTMRVYLPVTRYPQAADMVPVLTNLEDRLREVSGVAASALASAAPLIGGGGLGVEVDGDAVEPGETPRPATPVSISEDYFAVLGLEPLQGRTFNRTDGEPGSETVIVNQRFVDVHLGGGEALGRTVRLGAGPNADPAEGWMTVVGVVPNVRQAAIEDEETDPVAYRPLRATGIRNPYVMLRTVGDQGAVTSRVREVMRSVEPDVPVYEVNTMEALLQELRWPFRVFGIMFSFFAVAALLLSTVGLYSITAHSVIQRMREFGIRVSLGAEPREISRLALRRVLVQLAVGVPIGVAGAYAVGKLIQGFLVETAPGEPMVLVGIVAVLVSVAVVACLVPARRAGAVDPVTALRVE